MERCNVYAVSVRTYNQQLSELMAAGVCLFDTLEEENPLPTRTVGRGLSSLTRTKTCRQGGSYLNEVKVHL